MCMFVYICYLNIFSGCVYLDVRLTCDVCVYVYVCLCVRYGSVCLCMCLSGHKTDLTLDT